MILLPLLIAAISCTPNGDGSWTCVSTDPFPGLDEGAITTNSVGNYVCTNCVDMSPGQCQLIKTDILDGVNTLEMSLNSIYTAVSNASSSVVQQMSIYSSFDSCPYPASDPSLAILVAIRALGYPDSINDMTSRWNEVYSDYKHTYQVSNGFIPDPNITLFGSNQLTFRQSILQAHDIIVGYWDGSYRVAQSAYYALESIHEKLNTIPSRSVVQESLDATRSYAQSVSCAPCQLGTSSSSGGGSGGSGSETGCLECYLSILRDMRTSLGNIETSSASILTLLEDWREEVNRALSLVNSSLSSATNLLGRIDDYLQTDQREFLNKIEINITAISNEMYEVQHHLFDSYFKADTWKDKDDLDTSFTQMRTDVFGQNDDKFDVSYYSQLPWFNRVELLLSEIVGVNPSNMVESVETDEIEDSLNDTVDEFQSNSSLYSSASGRVLSLFSDLKDVFTSVRDNFGVASVNTSGVLLLSSDYWFGDSDLVLKVPVSVQNFSRLLFQAIWVVLFFVGALKLVMFVWSAISGVLRWLFSLVDT